MSGVSFEDIDDSALCEGKTRKFVESERAIPPRIVESDEGTPPLMLEGERRLTFDTGIVGAKEQSSRPVGTAADKPWKAWSLSPHTVLLLRLQQGLGLQGVHIVCPMENPGPCPNRDLQDRANR